MQTVYALSSRGKVHWIGRTKNLHDRVSAHVHCLRSAHNVAKRRWLVELRRRGVAPDVTVLAVVPAKAAAAEEAKFIEQFRTAGHPLANLSPGFGKHSIASRRKMSRQRQGSRHPLWRHDIDNATLVRLFEQGLSCAEIAARLGTGATTVHRRLRDAGVNTTRYLGWKKRKRVSNGGSFA